jgi:TPR repeat protein
MTISRAFMRALAVSAVLLVGSFSAVPAFANFEDGVRAYLAQEYTAALDIWRPLAEEGHAPAQFGMGLSYENGRGVERDPTQAAVWYHKAADQGLADAQFNLGNLYLNASGVPKDPIEAVRWFRRAADQGMPHAQVNLGYSYETGSGVAKDPVKAVSWYAKAAEQDFPQAQYYLGAAYERGSGVEENLALAAAWYERAAEQGVVLAGKRFDVLTERGVEPDVIELKSDREKVEAAESEAAPEPEPEAAPEEPPAAAEEAPPAETSMAESSPPEPEVAETVPEPEVVETAVEVEREEASADPVTTPETVQAGERVPSLGNSFRVRLASYRKPASATKGWKILSNKHEDLLAPLNHAVAEVDLGAEKGIYHRLEAGPLGSLAEAKELCAEIKSRGDSCVAVKP